MQNPNKCLVHVRNVGLCETGTAECERAYLPQDLKTLHTETFFLLIDYFLCVCKHKIELEK